MNKEKNKREIWAENEIRMACKEERMNAMEDERDMLVACNERALEAFRSLLDDDFTGMSIRITKDILNRLIDGKALTPIENTEDVWEEVRTYVKGCKWYQCKRMNSLYKIVYDDGRVKYSDMDRFLVEGRNRPILGNYNEQVVEFAGELFPIQFPYVPETYKVFCDEHLTDRKNGYYDTLAIFDIEDPDKTIYHIDEYFAKTEKGWRNIAEQEWMERVQMHIDRIKREFDASL